MALAKKNSLRAEVKKYFVVSLYFINLLLILFFKYFYLSNPLSNFSLIYTGNAIIFIIFIILIVFHVFYIKTSYNKRENRQILLIVLVAFNLILLIACYLFKYYDVKIADTYLLYQPVERTILSIFLFLHLAILIFIVFVYWNILHKQKSLIYLKSFFDTAVAITAIFLYAFIYSQFSANIAGNIPPQESKNIGVVLGAAVWKGNIPSDIFKARIITAHQLLDSGKIEYIQLMGGSAPNELPEAEVAAKFLLDLGVKSNKLFIENLTSSTVEQIKYIHKNLIPKVEDYHIIIISDEYHLVRVYEIAKFFNFKAYVYPSYFNLSYSKLFYHKLREGLALLFFWFFGL